MKLQSSLLGVKCGEIAHIHLPMAEFLRAMLRNRVSSQL